MNVQSAKLAKTIENELNDNDNNYNLEIKEISERLRLVKSIETKIIEWILTNKYNARECAISLYEHDDKEDIIIYMQLRLKKYIWRGWSRDPYFRKYLLLQLIYCYFEFYLPSLRMFSDDEDDKNNSNIDINSNKEIRRLENRWLSFFSELFSSIINDRQEKQARLERKKREIKCSKYSNVDKYMKEKKELKHEQKFMAKILQDFRSKNIFMSLVSDYININNIRENNIRKRFLSDKKFPPLPLTADEYFEKQDGQTTFLNYRKNDPYLYEREESGHIYDDYHSRFTAGYFIHKMAEILKVEQDVVIKSLWIFHRFLAGYYVKIKIDYSMERYKIALSCFYLACKSQSLRIRIYKIIRTAHLILECCLIQGDEDLHEMEQADLEYYEIIIIKVLNFQLTLNSNLRNVIATKKSKRNGLETLLTQVFCGDNNKVQMTDKIYNEMFLLDTSRLYSPLILYLTAAYVVHTQTNHNDGSFMLAANSICYTDYDLKQNQTFTKTIADQILAEYDHLVYWKKTQELVFQEFNNSNKLTCNDNHEVEEYEAVVNRKILDKPGSSSSNIAKVMHSTSSFRFTYQYVKKKPYFGGLTFFLGHFQKKISADDIQTNHNDSHQEYICAPVQTLTYKQILENRKNKKIRSKKSTKILPTKDSNLKETHIIDSISLDSSEKLATTNDKKLSPDFKSDDQSTKIIPNLHLLYENTEEFPKKKKSRFFASTPTDTVNNIANEKNAKPAYDYVEEKDSFGRTIYRRLAPIVLKNSIKTSRYSSNRDRSSSRSKSRYFNHRHNHSDKRSKSRSAPRYNNYNHYKSVRSPARPMNNNRYNNSTNYRRRSRSINKSRYIRRNRSRGPSRSRSRRRR